MAWWAVTTWWRIRQWVRHPAGTCRWYWKRRHVPRPGDLVTDCRGKTLRVTAVDGDDLTLEDGVRASWMHCCGYPENSR